MKKIKEILKRISEIFDRNTILYRKERVEVLLKKSSLWEGKESVEEGALVQILIAAGNQRQEEERLIFVASPNLSIEGVEILSLESKLDQALLGKKKGTLLSHIDGEERRKHIHILSIE